MNVSDEVARESDGSEFPATVELHIEELMLDGFAAGDRFRIGDAVEAELTRLITERGLPGLAGSRTSIERLDGGVFPVAPGARGGPIGRQVARAMYTQLAAAARPPSPSSRVGSTSKESHS